MSFEPNDDVLSGNVYEIDITHSFYIGNTWRPDNYELCEEKIEILQKAAHDAVAAAYGADYAKDC